MIIDEMPSNLFVGENETHGPDIPARKEVFRRILFQQNPDEFEWAESLRDSACALIEDIITSNGSHVDLPDDVLE